MNDIKHVPLPNRSVMIALVSFFISVIACTYVFSLGRYFYDNELWVDASNIYYFTGDIPEHHPIFGYPALTIIIPTAYIANTFKLDATITLNSVLTIMLSLCISGSILISYILRPQSLWWLCIGIAFLTDIASYLFFRSTPPSAFIGVLIPFFVLLCWYIIEQNRSWKSYALLGFITCLMILTRYDIGFIVLASAFCLFILTDKKAALIVAGATLCGIFINPLLWFDTVSYISTWLTKVDIHLHKIGGPSLSNLMLLAPFSFMGVLFGIINLFKNKKRFIPTATLWWSLIITFILFFLIFNNPFHPIWYFIPLIIMWQFFFTLYLLEFLKERFQQETIVFIYTLTAFLHIFIYSPYGFLWERIS